MAVRVACMAIYWPTPGFKGRTFKLSVLIRWDFNFCVRSSPLREERLMYLYAKLHTHKRNKAIYFTAFLTRHVTDTAYRNWRKTWLSPPPTVLHQGMRRFPTILKGVFSARHLLLQKQLFSSDKSSIFDRRGMVRNNKMCNEELAARVKTMIDEDARFSLEKTASANRLSYR